MVNEGESDTETKTGWNSGNYSTHIECHQLIGLYKYSIDVCLLLSGHRIKYILLAVDYNASVIAIGLIILAMAPCTGKGIFCEQSCCFRVGRN